VDSVGQAEGAVETFKNGRMKMAKWEFTNTLTEEKSPKFETKSFDFGNSLYVGFKPQISNARYGFIVSSMDTNRTIARLLVNTGINLLLHRPKVIFSHTCWKYHVGLRHEHS